jgi:hypothetical protein
MESLVNKNEYLRIKGEMDAGSKKEIFPVASANISEETLLARAEYSLESAIDDFNRELYVPAAIEFENAKDYLDQIKIRTPEIERRYEIIEKYLPLAKDKAEDLK